ncbi:hypothetical protein [Acetobacterium bakii]|uniref:Uncharacterized protein n=1 Tax=Acetobacterium bakii TaxID=52689 RepID=A0A0L6TWK3_9FIRM|nr:hypothetical protein [Acetobacterium bakii]KNZ40442.1 hypothetical protein AKG39_17660 [Acetobacterium bakii]
MALTEVKRFMNYIAENRKTLEEYNKKLLESGSFVFTDPVLVSSGYYVSPMLPENLEDELLQRIIDMDEKSARKLEKISESQGKKISLKDRLVRKFDELWYPKETPEERILTRDEAKRHKIFNRLAELARDDGFDISTDDLLYYIGKSVMVIIKEHPEYEDAQIFDAILNSFE